MENIIYYQFIYLKKLLIGNSLIPDFYCKSTELMRRQDSRYHLEIWFFLLRFFAANPDIDLSTTICNLNTTASSPFGKLYVTNPVFSSNIDGLYGVILP